LQEFAFFSSGVLIFQFSRVAVNILSARTLGPEKYAPWNVMQPVLAYYALLTLGIPNAMNREVPFLMGAGKSPEAQKVADTSFTSLCLLLLAGFAVCAPLSTTDIGGLNRSSLFIFAILLVVWQFYNFGQVILKSRIEFKRMSFQLALFGAVYPILTLWGTNKFGFNGFLLGNVITAALVVGFIFLVSPLKVHWSLDINRTLGLVRIGWPIMGAGLLFVVFMSTDRWLIASLLGRTALGFYTLAAIASSLLYIIPSIVGQQIYPRMAHQYGKTNDVRKLKRYMFYQIGLNLSILVPIVSVAFVTLPLLVERYMPAFSGGITAARIILVGLIPLCLVSPFSSFLNTVNRQVWYLMAQFVGILCNILLGLAFIWMGMGLEGVATSTALSYLIYTFFIMSMGLLAYRHLAKDASLREVKPTCADEQTIQT
jgi:O-antigen/teichoic acid export membrane protein